MNRLLNHFWAGIAVVFLTAPCAAPTAPIPTGYSKMLIGNGTNALTVFTYKPKNYAGGPMLLVFHGMSRTAEHYTHSAAPLANRHGLIVIAPLFDTNQFPGRIYNLGGVKVDGRLLPPSEWIYQRVPEIIRTVREREDKPDLPYYMIGHSAGAQFVMRYAALMPAGAIRMVSANPGSDLFPRRDWDFGYGFGDLPPDLSDDAALQKYLADISPRPSHCTSARRTSIPTIPNSTAPPPVNVREDSGWSEGAIVLLTRKRSPRNMAGSSIGAKSRCPASRMKAMRC